MKRCRLCDTEKPVDEFQRLGESVDGRPIYASYCTPCKRRFDVAYQRRNRQAYRQYQREYHRTY